MVDQSIDGRAVPRPRRRSRLGSGCAILFCCLLVLAAVVAVGAYYIFSEVNRFTSSAPAPIPRHEVAPGEREALLKRIQEFESREAPASLELSERDLNTLLSAAAGGASPPVHARIKDGGLFIDASIELGQHPLLARFFAGRYLNASIGIELKIEEGRLRGRVESALAGNGERIRSEFLPLLSHEDLLGAFLKEGNLLPATGTARKVTVTQRAVVLEK